MARKLRKILAGDIAMPKTVYSHVIWDWNGTLLNDVDWCVAQMNHMLKKRNKKPLSNVSDYHKAFCFPIIEYYKNVGFDFAEEPFELLAKEFIELYHSAGSDDMKLHDNAEDVLKAVQDRRISQIILSATAQDNLTMQISPFGIEQYFDEILGIADIYAKSKVEMGLDYLKRNKVQSGIMIGDAFHDFEVAQAMGVECVLVTHGHQCKEELLSHNVPVFDNLNEVLQYIL